MKIIQATKNPSVIFFPKKNFGLQDLKDVFSSLPRTNIHAPGSDGMFGRKKIKQQT